MSGRTITFRGGIQTVLGFVLAFTAVLLVWIPLEAGVLGTTLPSWAGVVLDFARFAIFAAITWAVLRMEGVRPADLGLSCRLVAPAVVTFAGVWVALNALGVGLATVTGNPWGIGVLRVTTPEPFVTTLLFQFLVVGMVEEFALRGYLQTKLIAVFGDDSRVRIAAAIVAASFVFGLFHVPGALVTGASASTILLLVVARTASGIGFGLVYELTHNLYFVALLHGLGNTWPLVVDWFAWSGGAFVAFAVGVVCIYLAATFLYRYWTVGTERTPDVHRAESEVAA